MTSDFPELADRIVDALLSADPNRGRWAGDHGADGQLPDFSDDAVRRHTADLVDAGNALAEVDEDTLGVEDDVDRQLLAAAVDADLFAATELDERSWNPLLHNPGDLFYALLTQDALPVAERAESLRSRLAAVPDAMATADAVLHDCPRVHVETALVQLPGTIEIVRDLVPAKLAELGADGVDDLTAAAVTGLERHRATLQAMLDSGAPGRDPRLGRRRFEAKLWHELDAELTAAEIMRRAEAAVVEATAEMTELAQQLTGSPDIAAALATVAQEHPDDTTILPRCADALTQTTAFVTEHELVTVLPDPVDVIEMPEYARGIAAAYCDAPGGLETLTVPTLLAVSPTPADWSSERVASFYREYNDHMLQNLMVHEAMPGHYLQLCHERRFRGASRVRGLCRSGSFVEGWAVYAERLMAAQGYGGPKVRLQQLKMTVRTSINAMLDQLVHCDDIAEADAMALMTERGFQEDGEAAGKWRRALLSSAQLSTYFVGHAEISAIAAARPDGTSMQSWHDRMLAHGSPSPRHLPRLLGLS